MFSLIHMLGQLHDPESLQANKEDFFIHASRVFNKVGMCTESGEWQKYSSEWHRFIEMRLESKLIFSTGQRAGYG